MRRAPIGLILIVTIFAGVALAVFVLVCYSTSSAKVRDWYDANTPVKPRYFEVDVARPSLVEPVLIVIEHWDGPDAPRVYRYVSVNLFTGAMSWVPRPGSMPQKDVP